MKRLVNYVVLAVIALVLATPTYASPLCQRDAGIQVAFFNGVWNTTVDAVDSMESLMEVTGRDYMGQLISYEAMYNSTGVDNGASKFEDVAETFIQRGQEIGFDPSVNFHMFMDALNGESTGFFDKVSRVLGGVTLGLASTIEDLRSFIVIKATGVLSSLVSNPPTANDYYKHQATINTFVLQGEKILMVGHSQGNLFLNQSYNYALSLRNVSTRNVAALHIAPASTVTNGPHVLADQDVIINGLRILGITAVPAITAYLPLSHVNIDKSGHEFVKTYLKQGLEPVEQLKSHFQDLLATLEAPAAIGSVGSFTGTLIWDKPGDIDLHIIEPNGRHVYHGSRRGYVGYLDVDDRWGTGPEHYFATCEPDILQEGVYQFAINNYAGDPNALVTLQASTANIAALYTKQVIAGPRRGYVGDYEPVVMFSVDVTKDENGNFEFNIIK